MPWRCLCSLAVALFALDGSMVRGDDLFPILEFSREIDAHLAQGWRELGVTPAPRCDDATFLRRASLDLLGRIPTIAEVREFTRDTDPQKRARWVLRCLESPLYARHWATFWRRTWVPQTETNQFQGLADGLERWLAAELEQDTPYDRLIHALLVADETQPDGAIAATTFSAASEFKPENLAANTTRAFLGLNLECAQCHDHPFSRWTRDEFWQTAAFFVRPPPAAAENEPVRLELAVGDTERKVMPKLLVEQELVWPEKLEASTGRQMLASWVAGPQNPYLARNAANRVWAQLFGQGLVEPLDDLSEENPPSHPALLDALSQNLSENGFQLKQLIAACMLSEAYQQAAVTTPNPTEDRTFSSASVRALTGEQLFDSLQVAAGLPVTREDLLANTRPQSGRKLFVRQFRVERAVASERSILQALALMNGPRTQELTDARSSPLLASVAEAPFLSPRERIEALFLATVGRSPGEEELAPLLAYLTQGGAEGSTARERLADLLWALFNSSEFNTNH